MIGKVEWFKDTHGVINAENGESFFVFFRGINSDSYKTLEPEQKVEFEVAPGLKGPVAINVRVIED